ncbi:MAG: molybdopterin-dependent oxidoreductase [Bryobacterales bacterium]|nr:molybdopterin-dependent oxidoreductase [Bryobacterales bacterium]
MLKKTIRDSSVATLIGLVPHYLAFYLAGTPLLTESIAEWIMKNTPSAWALSILDTMGPWAKPFAVTGGLFVLGLCLWIPAMLSYWRNRKYERFVILAVLAVPAIVTIHRFFEYRSAGGAWAFWAPALIALFLIGKPHLELLDEDWGEASEYAHKFIGKGKPRRGFLKLAARVGLPAVMGGGVVLVAVESYLRELAAANRASAPVTLFSFRPPTSNTSFAPGLVRAWLTPVEKFYRMSKNAVDPAIDPRFWRLEIKAGNRTIRSYSYAELLSMKREIRAGTLRCISNTLNSDLMANAVWAGLSLGQLVERSEVPPGTVAVVFEGIDGHGDSLSVEYAFGEETFLALGMNGETLNRQHGFPIRMLCPRYYGFKNIKWLKEIRFATEPYTGTYQKMGYTREAFVYTMSTIDELQRAGDRVQFGGVAFAGSRGIRKVEVRVGGGEWSQAEMEPALAKYSWVRYKADLPVSPDASVLEVRAMDGDGAWQTEKVIPMFPSGVAGPTTRKLPV